MIHKLKGSRHIPLVFVGGAANKVSQVKDLLPDASYTTWEEIEPTHEHAITNPPSEPVVHESTFAGYAGSRSSRSWGSNPR
jgi:hypothetical protein